ncbi:MAG TPA: tetratricopeptide repeat protein [Terriglobia bacterium]|nr:tetratricopeptide repeat protein [Terriglobia bacterium]
MKIKRSLLRLPIAAVVALSAASPSFCKSKQVAFMETGTLTEMQAVPCGSRAKGFTGIGGLLATAGLEDVNSKDKLCQEYVLRTSYMEYRIRPVNDKDPALLPVGEKSRFRIVKDRVLLSVPDGDGKVREYVVVGMRPLHMETDSQAALAEPSQGPPQLQRRPAADPVKSADPVEPNQPVRGTTTASVATPLFPAHTISPAQPVASPSANSQAAAPAPKAEPDSSGSEPLTRAQVMGLVAGGVASERVIALVDKRGLGFQPTPEFLTDLKSVGASEDLLTKLSQTRQKVTPEVNTGANPASEQPSVVQPADPAQLRQLQGDEQRDRAAELARPDDPNVHFALADVLGREGKWSDAAAQYAAVISSQPNDAAAHDDLALALRKSGNIDSAIREYRRAVALDPTRAAFHDNLGVALSQKGDAQGAMAEFREAIRQDPSNFQAHDNLGSMLEEQKDLDGAIREYQQALSVGGGAEAEYNLATALELKGNLDGAIAAFRQASTASPNDVRTRCALAGALERKGDMAGALQQYAIAVKLAPQDAAVRAHYDRLSKSYSAQNAAPGS